MKIATLRCIVVIALSLMAARAGAQLDSNAEVILHCSDVCGDCNMMVIHTFLPTLTRDSFQLSRRVCLPSDVSLRYLTNDTVNYFYDSNETFKYFINTSVHGFNDSSGTTLSIAFVLDTTANLLRNVILTSTQQYSYFVGGEVLGTDILQLHLGTLPYLNSAGNLLINGIFPGSYSFFSYLSGPNLHSIYDGYCSDSEETIDTLTLKIVSNGFLEVLPNQANENEQSIIVLEQSTESVLARFSAFMPSRSISIYDFLGREVDVIPILGDVNSVQLNSSSIAPGCYFARLGDQVAKFVVPPR